MVSALRRLFSPSPEAQAAQEAYVQLVAQARRPVFYRDWEVPDTLDGRFDMIVAHLFLIVQRGQAEAESPSFIRVLSEAFFADMDRNLREMGSTDTGVGIRIKKMAQAFYGRLAAYESADTDREALDEALRRNVWREGEVSPPAVQALAAYLRRQKDTLAAQDWGDITAGKVTFSE